MTNRRDAGESRPDKNMKAPRETLYDVLGIPRDAKRGEIVRACQRLAAELRQDTTPPDRRREARIHEAFEVLTDETRRAEYDGTLVLATRNPDRRRIGVIAGVVAALAAVAAYLFLAQGAPSAKAGRTVKEIQADVVSSVGRVRSIDLSGKAVSTGLAFTVAKGVMATTCEGLAPGAQVVVTIGARAVPARIASVDEGLGLCTLAVDGAGSWPLPLVGAEPKVGDKVYAAGVNAAGEVVLTDGVVKRVATDAHVRIVEAAVPAATGDGGRPLLDINGRVVGVATAAQPGGAVRHVMVPSEWAGEYSAPTAVRAPPPGEVSSASPRETGAAAKAPGNPLQGIAEEKARKIQLPQTVPDDL